MTKRQVKPRRKSLGRPLNTIVEPRGEGKNGELTNEQLAALYANQEDRELAKMYVEKYGTPRFRGMLEAEPEDDKEDDKEFE